MDAKEILEEKMKMLNSLNLNSDDIKKAFDEMDDKSIIIEDYLTSKKDDSSNQSTEAEEEEPVKKSSL